MNFLIYHYNGYRLEFTKMYCNLHIFGLLEYDVDHKLVNQDYHNRFIFTKLLARSVKFGTSFWQFGFGFVHFSFPYVTVLKILWYYVYLKLVCSFCCFVDFLFYSWSLNWGLEVQHMKISLRMFTCPCNWGASFLVKCIIIPSNLVTFISCISRYLKHSNFFFLCFLFVNFF